MKRGVALMGGLGVGATLMYFFDPDRGKRRRALVGDRAKAVVNRVAVTSTKLNRDLRNRGYGLLAEARNRFKQEGVRDSVLVDRVRSKIGRASHHVGALQVTAQDGVVTLQGPINANELDRVLRAARSVRGVKEVHSQLEVQEQAGDISALRNESSVA